MANKNTIHLVIKSNSATGQQKYYVFSKHDKANNFAETLQIYGYNGNYSEDVKYIEWEIVQLKIDNENL
jgi:hypothetical protein